MSLLPTKVGLTFRLKFVYFLPELNKKKHIVVSYLSSSSEKALECVS